MISQKSKLKVVALGGGTGLSTLVKGLKKHENLQITAIVSVTDEGGSSGQIRKEFKVPPPGDVRNNFIAMSYKEEQLEKLFNFRFKNGFLNGHTVGNIILTALAVMNNGSLAKAVKALSEILAINGRIIPVSDELVRLVAIMDDGSRVIGEINITKHGGRIKKLMLDKDVSAEPEAVEAIKEADAIMIGPGSLYTSVITNLIVKGIKEAISESKAKKIYISNIMTQPGETSGMSLSEHLKEVENYMEGAVDFVVVNTELPPKEILKAYEENGYHPVKTDVENIKRTIIMEPMLKVIVDPFDGKKKLRHDSEKLAKVLVKVLNME